MSCLWLVAAALLALPSREAFRLGSRASKKPKFKATSRFRGAYGWGDGSITEDDAAPMQKRSAVCFESFAAPERGSRVCPAECPLLRFDQDWICHWKCITEEWCLTAPNMPSSVANHETGMCAVCAVPGCAYCGQTGTRCRQCKDGFELEGHQCLPHSRHWWRLVYAAASLLALLALVYAVCVAWRPVVNETALSQALQHRSYTKTRKEKGKHKLMPLHINLCETFIPSGGAGTLLHFRFQRSVLRWSSFVLLVMASVNYWHRRLRAVAVLEVAPMHDEALHTCLDLEPADESALEAMRVHFLWATGLVYLGSSVGALYFAIRQRRKYAALQSEVLTMEDYALWCGGFPEEAGDTARGGNRGLEEEYAAFFASAWGESVLGVSVVWDTAEETDRDQIDTMVQMAMDRRERDFEQEMRDSGTRGEDPGESAAAACGPPDTHARGCLLDPQMRCIDGILWGTPCGGASAEESQSMVSPSDAVKLVSRLKTAGSVFVILRTEPELQVALKTPLPRFRDEHEIRVEHLACDAEAVLWDNFTTSNRQRVLRTLLGIGTTLLVIMAWALCVYGPYAYYILSWSSTAGQSQGGVKEGALLGILICAGNQIVYAVCANSAEQVCFTNRYHRDMFYMVLYTCAIFINTALDMWLVVYMAHGWQQDSGVDPEAMVRNPSLQHALFVQLIFYLWPWTLLFPFLMEPIVLNIIPYYFGKRLVRSNKDVTRKRAEQCLACAPFDINRYGDILINMMLVILIFFLTSANIWWIFFMFTVSNSFLYLWDHYRFLRETQRTHFATQEVDLLGQYFTALPCAMLAGAFMFKLHGGQAMVKSWGRGTFLAYHPEWFAVILAIALHLALHVLALAVVVPRLVPAASKRDPVTYMEAAARIPCNWFNSSAVHCLRSTFLYGHSPPHVYYVPGKEYLHKKNTNPRDAQALIVYEAHQFVSDTKIAEDVRAVRDHFVEEVAASIGHLRGLGRSVSDSIAARRTPALSSEGSASHGSR